MDGKTVYIGPANACEIVAHRGVEIYAQPGSDHVLRAGAYASRPLEGGVLLLPWNGLVAVNHEVVGKEVIHFSAGKHVDPPAGAADNVKVEVDGSANPVLHVIYGYLGEHKAVIGVICGEGAAEVCVIDTCTHCPSGSEVPFDTKAHGERETGFVRFRNRIIYAFLGNSGSSSCAAAAQERSLGTCLEIAGSRERDIPAGKRLCLPGQFIEEVVVVYLGNIRALWRHCQAGRKLLKGHRVNGCCWYGLQ